MISAAEFRSAFVTAFDEARHNEVDWRATWGSNVNWSNFMLFGGAAVIERSAQRLGFRCRDEMLRFDKAMFPATRPGWFPMHVALEHESDCYGFSDEIYKLMSARARLKVGITYALKNHRRQNEIPNFVASAIRDAYKEIAALVSEDPRTEYLFLIGQEAVERELLWLELSFRSEEGPGQAKFLPCQRG